LGAIAYQSPQPQEGRLLYFSQLLLTREIFGVDADALHPIRRMGDELIFDPGTVETSFTMTVHEYVRFARSTLGIEGPLQVIAGLVDVKGYAVMPGHPTFRSSIDWRGVYDHAKPTWQFLRPFFEEIWQHCGVQRAANADEALFSFLPGRIASLR
jgi:hypothetical protein